MNLVAKLQATYDSPTDLSIKDATDGVATIAELLHKYGGFIVILSVFILLFIIIITTVIYINNKMIKSSMEEKISLLNSQTSQNDKLLDHILRDEDDETSVSTNTNDKRKDLVGTYIDINLILKDAVRTATNELNAERVAIYVFHNGNESIHGLPFFKVSCIHEWSKVNSVAMKTRPYRSITHHSIPLYLLSDIVEDIYEKHKYATTEVQSKIDDSNCLRTFVEHSDIETIYAIAIEDDSNTIGGFVVAEFKSIMDLSPSATKKIQRVLETTRDTVRPVVVNLNGQYSIIHENM